MNFNGKNNDLSNYSWGPIRQNHQETPQVQSNEDHLISELEDLQQKQQQQQQQQQQHKQKKKSHSNRKMQRYRRKLRDQGIDPTIVAEVISSTGVHMNSSVLNQVTQEREKTTKSTSNEIHFRPSKSFKKNKKSKVNERGTIIKKKNIKSTEFTSMRKVKPPIIINDSIDYATVPDEVFSQMLCEAFNGIEKRFCFLNEDEKIKFIRHYTSLIDRLSYVQLQEFQWKYYHQIGMTQNIWNGHMAKHVAEKYSICHIYGRSKSLIQQRLNQIAKQLQQAHGAIQQFEHEILSKCVQYDDFSRTIRELSSIIYQFVQEKQRPLKHEFEYKREMLIMDATDHQIVQKFFDVKPNKSHIISARHIWQATMQQMLIEEEIALLEHRLTSTQSQTSSNLLGRMIDDINRMLTNSNETVQTSVNTSILSNEIERMQALKRDIIHQAINTSRGIIKNFEEMIEFEKKKYTLKNRFMESTSEWQKIVLNVIEMRRLHMIHRSKFTIKYKLTTFVNKTNDLQSIYTT